MSTRITQKDLETACTELNKKLGRPTSYHGDNGTNIRHLNIAAAYGGYRVEEITNESGASRVPSGFDSSFYSARKVYSQLQSALGAISLVKV